MIGGVAAAAAVRTFPFRVFSFPTEIEPTCWSFEVSQEVLDATLAVFRRNLTIEAVKAWQARKFYCSEQFIVSPPELAGMRYIKGALQFKNLSRSPHPFRAGVT